MFCEKCGTKLQDNEQFCPNCGTPRNIAQPANNSVKTAKIKKFKPKKEKSAMPKKTKKAIIALTSVIVVLVIAIGVLLPVLNGIKHAGDADVVFFVDNGELYARKTGSEYTVQLSKKLLLEEDYSDNAGYMRSVCVSGTHFLKDKNMAIFPDRIDTDEGAVFSLYSLKLDKKAVETDPAKIDGDIRYGYVMTSDGQRLFYCKADKTLYCNDFSERKKIADNVDAYYVNDTGKIILYTVYSDEKTALYTVNPDTLESTKIADSVTIEYCADDYSAIGYTTDNAVCVLINGTQSKKLADYNSEESYVSIQYANAAGQAFYTISENESDRPNVTAFIEDDMLQADSSIKEPDRNDQKYWETWTEGWFGPSVSKYTDEYYRLKEEYEQKQSRDRLRNNLKNETIYLSNSVLYYFDGTNSVKLNDRIDYSPFQIDDLAVFSAYNPDEVGKIKFSEIVADGSDMSVSDVRNSINEKLNQTIRYYIVKAGNITELAIKGNPYQFLTNADETSLFFLVSSEDNKGSDLYKADLSGGKVGEPKLSYTNVAGYFFNDSGSIVNFRDPITLNDSYYTTCDLYVNDQKIDTGVYFIYENPSYSVTYSNDGTMFYQTDYSSGSYSFTIKQYDGKETKSIASDVSQFFPVAKDNIFYIDNYSESSYEGDLKHFDGKEIFKVASSALVVFAPEDN